MVSGSEVEESASSSQESATTGFVSFFDFGSGFGLRSDVEM